MKDLQEQIHDLSRRIGVLEAKLRKLESQSSPPSPPPSSRGSGQAWLLSKKMEAKQRILDEVRNAHYSETPLGGHWDNGVSREKYIKLKAEIKALNEQLASL